MKKNKKEKDDDIPLNDLSEPSRSLRIEVRSKEGKKKTQQTAVDFIFISNIIVGMLLI